MKEPSSAEVSPDRDSGNQDGLLPGRAHKFVENLVKFKGKFRYDNPHLWLIAVLFAICILIYYGEQFFSAIGVTVQLSIFQTVHDLHRSLFLIPLVYTAIAFRLRGSLFGSLIFLAAILPRSFLYSNLPDPLLRPLIFFFLASVLSIVVAVQLNYIEYQIKTRGDLLKLSGDVAALAATREDLTRFFNRAAHDMKSPLVAVQSYLNTMLGGYAGELNDKQKSWLARSNLRIDELYELITDILDISRIKNTPATSEMKVFSLKDEIEQCISDFRAAAERKEISLVTDIKDDSLEIFGSDTQIRRALTNLIDNAVKYTPDKGEVTVRAARREDYIFVEVIDNGIGIPAEELPRIFHDFYRASNAKSLKGTGLGLAIVREILTIHGGKISVESPAPGAGKGCRFSFVLPAKTSTK
jgi:signal transduction histidine kinase